MDLEANFFVNEVQLKSCLLWLLNTTVLLLHFASEIVAFAVKCSLYLLFDLRMHIGSSLEVLLWEVIKIRSSAWSSDG